MTRETVAYAVLLDAIDAETPPCSGDARYTADILSHDDTATLQLVCSTCPVLRLCRTYALAARPPAGVWAGERWAEKKRPGRPKGAARA